MHPVTEDELRRIRKYTRFNIYKSIAIPIAALVIITGLTFLFPLFDLIMGADLPILALFAPVIIQPATIFIAVLFIFRAIKYGYRLSTLGNWEQRSGVMVMDDVLRERYEKAEEERKKAQGG